jgi:hypothetical protein
MEFAIFFDQEGENCTATGTRLNGTLYVLGVLAGD